VNGAAHFALDLPDENASAALAARLATRVRPRDVIALDGPLGSGKTSFCRAFIRARLGAGTEVPSPTFTLVEIYGADPPIWHFDLFRIEKPEDAWELGIEDALADGVSLIEWPERLGALLPRERLDLGFAFAATPGARTLAVAPSPAWAARIADLAHG
jgi:tRNA threonylcarbamoyladenosine biosynthesis protein TsaE